MKENNIEEDIKILENMNDGYTFKDCDICNNYNEKTKQCDKHKCMELQAIEHILSDYKRVLKENEELNKKIKEQKECAFREDGTEECLWCCSNCHDEWLFYEGTPEENNLKYCPHCGARIREIIKLEEEDE